MSFQLAATSKMYILHFYAQDWIPLTLSTSIHAERRVGQLDLARHISVFNIPLLFLLVVESLSVTRSSVSTYSLRSVRR